MSDTKKDHVPSSSVENASPSRFKRVRSLIRRLGQGQRSEPRVPRPGDIPRRKFLQDARNIGGALSFTGLTEGIPSLLPPTEEDANRERLLKVDLDTLPTASEFAANRSEFFDIFSIYFHNQLKQTQFLISKQLLRSALQKPEADGDLDPLLTANQKAALFDKKETILQILEASEEDPLDADPLLREILDTFYSHTQSVAQVAYATLGLATHFESLPSIDQQLFFQCKPEQQHFLRVIGYFPTRFDYVSSRPLERYESDDSVETYEVLPEIQECIQKAHEVFGVPVAAITAILVMEGGGGVNGPGTTLTPEVQRQTIQNNFVMPSDLHLRNPDSGAAGPGQIMPGTLDTFRYAVSLIWPDEDPNNVDSLKHAVATIAAKLYIDSLVLFYAERFRYTSQYQSERDRQINSFYSDVTNGFYDAKDKSGLEKVLHDFGPLKEKDKLFTYLASIDYHGTDRKQARLGDRSYDEYIVAYGKGLRRQQRHSEIKQSQP